ncbi:MAG: hypothetical protein Q4G42_04105 [Neisseria sp.]|nr:hypothetical protein [Neisseria sp.]
MFRFFAVAGICTLLLIPIAGYSSNIIKNPLLLVLVSGSLAYVVLPALLLHLWPETRKSSVPESMESALWGGHLITTSYEVLDIAEIREAEDEGLHFLIATHAGTLFLSGQYLYELVGLEAFPCEEIRLFRHRETETSYGIEPVGKPINYWQAFELNQEMDKRKDWELEDGKIYHESMTEMIQRLHLVSVGETTFFENRTHA